MWCWMGDGWGGVVLVGNEWGAWYVGWMGWLLDGDGLLDGWLTTRSSVSALLPSRRTSAGTAADVRSPLSSVTLRKRRARATSTTASSSAATAASEPCAAPAQWLLQPVERKDELLQGRVVSRRRQTAQQVGLCGVLGEFRISSVRAAHQQAPHAQRTEGRLAEHDAPLVRALHLRAAKIERSTPISHPTPSPSIQHPTPSPSI
jgi:hypothetical protein